MYVSEVRVNQHRIRVRHSVKEETTCEATLNNQARSVF